MFDNEGYNPELNMEALKTSGPFYSEEPFLFYLFIYLFIFLFCFVKARWFDSSNEYVRVTLNKTEWVKLNKTISQKRKNKIVLCRIRNEECRSS